MEITKAFEILHNYLTFNKVLVELVPSCHVEEPKGVFYPPSKNSRRPKIIVYQRGFQEEELCTFLHEVGHWIDYCYNPKVYNITAFDAGQLDCWRFLKPKDKAKLYKLEARAWKYGREIATTLVSDLSTEFWQLYERQQKHSLALYSVVLYDLGPERTYQILEDY